MVFWLLNKNKLALSVHSSIIISGENICQSAESLIGEQHRLSSALFVCATLCFDPVRHFRPFCMALLTYGLLGWRRVGCILWLTWRRSLSNSYHGIREKGLNPGGHPTIVSVVFWLLNKNRLALRVHTFIIISGEDIGQSAEWLIGEQRRVSSAHFVCATLRFDHDQHFHLFCMTTSNLRVFLERKFSNPYHGIGANTLNHGLEPAFIALAGFSFLACICWLSMWLSFHLLHAAILHCFFASALLQQNTGILFCRCLSGGSLSLLEP